MIKFFRRFREQLLRENRFGKYMLYAFGEIVLVVIGILIALQINNWNENSKDENLYLNYLVRLKSDFENLHQNVEFVGKWTDELVDLAEYQADFLNGKLTSLDTLKLAISIEFTSSVNRYNINLPTASELSSTGRLTIIKNDTLKNFLNNWQGHRNYRESENSEWRQWIYKYRDLVRNILTKEDKIKIDFSWTTSYPNDSNWESFKLNTNGDKITNELSEIPMLPGLLNDIIVERMITRDYLDQEKRMASETIELIQREINKLNK
ncbi:DUF6090 family protein [Muriicola sp. Z0-33]|uniref:DUF6090 family protein n=1 Tax=Muriicola sp. Z0-33 TaxID=2816957 RepID=UPI002237996F|nr:DUF6090 family protein [Muriicola sp. Z0-33]MCW5516482.1 hypothetical protein [Muriicola sp. Z0-33]